MNQFELLYINYVAGAREGGASPGGGERSRQGGGRAAVAEGVRERQVQVRHHAAPPRRPERLQLARPPPHRDAQGHHRRTFTGRHKYYMILLLNIQLTQLCVLSAHT